MQAEDQVYMLFVHHYGTARVVDEFPASQAHLTITNGSRSDTVKLEVAGYSGEPHWLAGCLRLQPDGGFQFIPVQATIFIIFTERSEH